MIVALAFLELIIICAMFLLKALCSRNVCYFLSKHIRIKVFSKSSRSASNQQPVHLAHDSHCVNLRHTFKSVFEKRGVGNATWGRHLSVCVLSSHTWTVVGHMGKTKNTQGDLTCVHFRATQQFEVSRFATGSSAFSLVRPSVSRI